MKNVYDIIYGTSITELGKALSVGQISEKTLRRVYNERRRTARRRLATISSEAVKAEFGNQPNEYFQRSQNLVTTSQLIHALVDVNKFMRSGESTISGLRHQKEQYIERAHERGLPVNESNYAKWIEFIRWFKTSMYAALYDSDSPEVEEAFSEGINAAEWTAAFEKIRIWEHNRPQDQVDERYYSKKRERR